MENRGNHLTYGPPPDPRWASWPSGSLPLGVRWSRPWVDMEPPVPPAAAVVDIALRVSSGARGRLWLPVPLASPVEGYGTAGPVLSSLAGYSSPGWHLLRLSQAWSSLKSHRRVRLDAPHQEPLVLSGGGRFRSSRPPGLPLAAPRPPRCLGRLIPSRPPVAG